LLQESFMLRVARNAGLAVAAIVLLPLAGCNSAPAGPPTHPVRGRIEFVRGGTVEQLNNVQATIVFQSVEDPSLRAYGEILEDGTFSLGSTKEGVPLSQPGVVAGEYRGWLAIDEEHRHLVAPEFLRAEGSNISFTAPAAEEVVVKVWR
jgi:hypothetical protein